MAVVAAEGFAIGFEWTNKRRWSLAKLLFRLRRIVVRNSKSQFRYFVLFDDVDNLRK